MKKRDREQRNRSHAWATILAGITLACVVLIVRSGSQTTTPGLTNISVEHASPLTLAVVMATKQQNALLELSHRGSGTALVVLPAEWTLREVRGAVLADVTADLPSFGAARWRLTRGVSLSFTVPHLPGPLFLYNPTNVPLQIHLKTIDLETGKTNEERYLVKERPARLW